MAAVHLAFGVLLLSWLTDSFVICPYGHLRCPGFVSRTRHAVGHFVKAAAAGETDAARYNVPDSPAAQATRMASSSPLFPGEQRDPSRELSQAEGTQDFAHFQEETNEHVNVKPPHNFPDSFPEPVNTPDTVLKKGYNPSKLKVFPKGTLSSQRGSFGQQEDSDVHDSIHPQHVRMPRSHRNYKAKKKIVKVKFFRTGMGRYGKRPWW